MKNFELAEDIKDAMSMKRSIEDGVMRRMEAGDESPTANVNIVQAVSDLSSDSMNGLLINYEIRPDQNIIPIAKTLVLGEDDMSDLHRVLSIRKTRDMASPFVPKILSDSERRPEWDIMSPDDIYIIDMSTFDSGSHDMDLIEHDMSGINNVPLYEMQEGTRNLISDLGTKKKEVEHDKTLIREVGTNILRELHVNATSNFFKGDPLGTYEKIEDEVDRLILREFNVPAAVWRDMKVLYDLCYKACEGEKDLDSSGRDTYTDSLSTPGYVFPSIIEEPRDLINTYDIGGSDYLLFK